MKTIVHHKRSIADLGYSVAAGVLNAIRLLEDEYGANDYHDSGHTKTSPTWIFKLPRYGNAEVGVRMNKRDTTLYMRDRTLDGKRLRDLIPATKVANVYPRDGNPAESVLTSAYLGPSASNEVLRLELEPDDVASVLAAFFGSSATSAPAHSSSSKPEGPEETTSNDSRRTVTEEDFAALLERRSETGRAGELLVILDELERLRACGCPRPEDYVKRVAETDVGRGYDVKSTWPGEERCIEVKTTTHASSDFFLTANERAVLTDLKARGWLYRVVMDSTQQGQIEFRLNDPMNVIAEAHMTPAVWRVAAAALKTERSLDAQA